MANAPVDIKCSICYNIHIDTQEEQVMQEPVELYCTQGDEGQWLVWFPHPLGGKHVLEEFASEREALAFWQEQMDGADYND